MAASLWCACSPFSKSPKHPTVIMDSWTGQLTKTTPLCKRQHETMQWHCLYINLPPYSGCWLSCGPGQCVCCCINTANIVMANDFNDKHLFTHTRNYTSLKCSRRLSVDLEWGSVVNSSPSLSVSPAVVYITRWASASLNSVHLTKQELPFVWSMASFIIFQFWDTASLFPSSGASKPPTSRDRMFRVWRYNVFSWEG